MVTDAVQLGASVPGAIRSEVTDAHTEPSDAPVADVTCTHCGLPVPSSLVDRDGGPSFCCGGCLGVYRLLSEAGLDDYYALREDAAIERRRPTVTDRTYTEFDTDGFRASHCQSDGRLLATTLLVEGVHCAACVWLVERIATRLDGVVEARLDLSSGVVRVVWDPDAVALSAIARRLDDLGYPVHPRLSTSRREIDRSESRDLLLRMGVAGASAGNAMMLAVALYAGAFDGMAAEHAALMRWASLIVSVPAVFYSATVFHRGAWNALRARTPHMDLPVSIGILVAFAGGVVNTVRGSGDVYFDSVTGLVFLLLVGRWVLGRHRRAAHDAADLLSALAPTTARVVAADGADGVVSVTAADVPIGAWVEVRPGEAVSVDGTVVEGHSTLDTSLLTGESMPVGVAKGDAVHAGTTNVAARIVVRADRVGRDTRVAGIVAKMEEARLARVPSLILADRVAGVFVVVVLSLAALVFAVHTWLGDGDALETTIALLVVTCPCALGLATPLTMSAALGQAARSGLLVKGGAAIEELARPGLVVFDKTGTLTQGKMEVSAVALDETLLEPVGALEQLSRHPVATALSSAAEHDGHPGAVHDVTDFEEVPGGGTVATVDGIRIAVGTLAHVGEYFAVPSDVASTMHAHTARGLTPVAAVAEDGRAAVFGLSDELRREAKEIIGRLHQLGHRVAILSGDRQEVVERMSRDLGVDLAFARGDVSPEGKLAFITDARRQGPVFMVGDGVNDAAALGAATAGIAIEGGAEASLAAADVFATERGLGPVALAFEGARRARRILITNVVVSLAYNTVTAALAILGFVGPLAAAVLMPLSSLSVVSFAYRARTFAGGPRRERPIDNRRRAPLRSSAGVNP